jgi:hypothetical protein
MVVKKNYTKKTYLNKKKKGLVVHALALLIDAGT